MLGSVRVPRLNVRTLPNTHSSVLDTLQAGALVEIEDKRGRWLEIRHQDRPAFVSEHYIDLYDRPPPLSAVITAQRLNVRAGPSLDSEWLGTLNQGMTLRVLQQQGDWLEVPFQGRSAFIARAFAELHRRGPIGRGRVTATLLNVRAEPKLKGRLLGQLPQGTLVDIDASLHQWHEIAFADGRGFIAGDYVEIIESEVTGEEHRVAANQLDDASPDSGITFSRDQLTPDRLLPEQGAGPERAVAQTWNRYGGLLQELSQPLELDVACTVAVLCVESSGSGFSSDNDGRMVIRFENHKFWKYWGHAEPEKFARHFRYRNDKVWLGHQWRPDVGDDWRSFHGNQKAEWEVLDFARSLDDTAALKSISMGAPQIMGFNHPAIGFHSVQEMFEAFCASSAEQIRGLFNFMSPAMIQRLQQHRFRDFAALYNGSGQQDKYGRWIKQHYDAFKRFR